MGRVFYFIFSFLLFCSSAIAALVVDKTSIDLGTVKPGVTVYGELIITNTGTVDVDVVDAVIEGAEYGFDISTTYGDLAAGDSYIVVVSFYQDNYGSYAGKLKVFTTEGTVEVPITVNVSGNKAISVYPSVVDFGVISIGSQGQKFITVENDGDVPVTIEGIEGISEPFSCDLNSTEIPIGGTLVVPCTFSPTEIGNYNLVAKVITDDPGVSAVVTLKGDALGADATYAYFTLNGVRIPYLVFPDTFIMETVSRTVTIHNPTIKDITVTAINAPSGFYISPESFTVPAGSSVDLTILFTPLRNILYGGDIQFVTESGETFSLFVIGRGSDFKVKTNVGNVVYSRLSDFSLAGKPGNFIPREFIAFDAFNFYPYKTVNVSIEFYAPEDNIVFYKILSNGEWVKLPSDWYDPVTHTLAFSLEDNGVYDLNPDVGIISDPIVVGVEDVDTPVSLSGNSGTGGGGCSMSYGVGGFTSVLPVLASLGGIYLLNRRRRRV